MLLIQTLQYTEQKEEKIGEKKIVMFLFLQVSFRTFTESELLATKEIKVFLFCLCLLSFLRV